MALTYNGFLGIFQLYDGVKAIRIWETLNSHLFPRQRCAVCDSQAMLGRVPVSHRVRRANNRYPYNHSVAHFLNSTQ